MTYLTAFFHKYGLFAVICMVFLEYACFPVSSEIVLPFTGAFARAENITLFLVLPLSVLAALLGTSGCYLVGYLGGNPLLLKIEKKWPKTKKAISECREKFERHGSFAVCCGRLIPLCRTYIAFVAGAVRQPYFTFVSFSMLGITLWNCVLIGLGYMLADGWSRVSEGYGSYKFILILLIPVAILLILFRKPILNKLKGCKKC